jgi:hypothetical protein
LWPVKEGLDVPLICTTKIPFDLGTPAEEAANACIVRVLHRSYLVCRAEKAGLAYCRKQNRSN